MSPGPQFPTSDNWRDDFQRLIRASSKIAVFSTFEGLSRVVNLTWHTHFPSVRKHRKHRALESWDNLMAFESWETRTNSWNSNQTVLKQTLFNPTCKHSTFDPSAFFWGKESWKVFCRKCFVWKGNPEVSFISAYNLEYLPCTNFRFVGSTQPQQYWKAKRVNSRQSLRAWFLYLHFRFSREFALLKQQL